MKVLLTNDDGIEAAGIRLLARRLALNHDVTVVAPEGNRSGVSHSITWLTPVRIREKATVEGVNSFCTSGTPADCVVAASTLFGDNVFDIVVSGINHGQNLGVDIRYSGTISAALEARTLGIPAIAVSVVSDENPDFLAALDFVDKFILYYDWRKLPRYTVLNVNVPSLPRQNIRGIARTRPGGLVKRRWFEKNTNEWGEPVYWMRREIIYELEESDLDFKCIKAGFISVSPIDFFQSCDEIYVEDLESDLRSFNEIWLDRFDRNAREFSSERRLKDTV
ncbi:5'-nucleotidase SurE [Mesotoga infera]|uniref:5'-nucleotidase SurE n=1 Tax=Mesotoga infera TaxID=1236046 RepID=A0A7Z7PSN5_9BACT|nr:5'/3'-nucleotidase SurE [Mesotoga infera]SSC13993.1 5'-nucleotidase SurE [Mesotoga infera]